MAVNCSSVTKEGITSGDFLMARSVNAEHCKGNTEKRRRKIVSQLQNKQEAGNTRHFQRTRVASLPSQLCSKSHTMLRQWTVVRFLPCLHCAALMLPFPVGSNMPNNVFTSSCVNMPDPNISAFCFSWSSCSCSMRKLRGSDGLWYMSNVPNS